MSGPCMEPRPVPAGAPGAVGRVGCLALLTALAASHVAAAPVAAGPLAAGPVAAGQTAPAPARQSRLSPLDQRVQLLAKELDLDERQQAEVRRILVQQQVDTRKAWSDESVPAQLRIAATRAIGEKTADRIRAVLNDRQRQRYNKPNPATPRQPASPDIDKWIDTVGGR